MTLKTQIASDQSVFYNSDEFATTAIYTPKGEPHPSSRSIYINGIFDNEYVTIGETESRKPVFSCSENDVESPRQDDQLQIDSVEYLVKGVEPDGTGELILILEKQ